MWTVGKSKELEEVRFSSVNPEEVYWVGLVGREAGGRMGGLQQSGHGGGQHDSICRGTWAWPGRQGTDAAMSATTSS